MPSRDVDDVPEGIVKTMLLLREGIDNEALVIVRQEMDDGGEQVVYDLMLARPVSKDDVEMVSLARLYPQQEDHLNDPAAAEASRGLH